MSHHVCHCLTYRRSKGKAYNLTQILPKSPNGARSPRFIRSFTPTVSNPSNVPSTSFKTQVFCLLAYRVLWLPVRRSRSLNQEITKQELTFAFARFGKGISTRPLLAAVISFAQFNTVGEAVTHSRATSRWLWWNSNEEKKA